MKHFLFSLLIITNSILFAQSKLITFETKWNDETKRCLPCDFNPTTNSIESVQTLPLNLKGDYNFKYTIVNQTYQNVELPAYVDPAIIATKAKVEVNFSKAVLENFISVSTHALLSQNGQTKLLTSITVKVDYTPNPANEIKGATFANESVLRKGSWYKFGVTKSGVYKIDKTQLEAAGVNTSTLNPQHINIYANHTPELPYFNLDYHPDDLIKNAIYVHGESDGTFDSGDYILFYATGTNVETNDGSTFYLSSNRHDSLNYVYLGIDASESPKRIQSASNSALPVTHNITDGDAAILYEQEDTNLLKSGDVWLGELFDIELSKTINVDLPGLKTSSPITMDAKIAYKKKTGSCNFNFLVGGNTVLSLAGTNNASDYYLAYTNSGSANFNASTSNFNVQINFDKGGVSSSVGWLDKMTFNYTRNLTLGDGQFICRDFGSVGVGNVTKYNVTSASSSSLVWEITDPTNIKRINANINGSNLDFTQNADSLRQFAVFNTSQAFTPTFTKKITQQNLHGLDFADYIIVTHSDFESQANRLADLHRGNGLTVHVVEIQKIYNEFSCGVSDPVAIKWFMKMFYDRAASDVTKMPKSLLLFGDGSYDPLNRQKNNTAKLPTFQSEGNSLLAISLTSSYTSDDFFALLDDAEGSSPNDLMDLGVGRFPVNTIEEAKAIVDKIEHYMAYGSTLFDNIGCDSDGYSSTFGDWRTRCVFVADDENNNTFVKDCEGVSDLIKSNHNEMNVTKIYLDAYQQIATSGGQRYPDVETAINEYINYGSLIFNYIGHGGEVGLAAERILTLGMINSWQNINKLPVFVSATCEFSRFDDPERVSAGEQVFLNPNGGAVSMLTTTRLVYISTNTTLNNNLYSVFLNEVNGEPLTLGEIMRQTKNLTSGLSSMRNFTLLGDPALTLGKPRPNIVLDSINGVEMIGNIDTLKSLSKIRMSGHIEDYQGNILTNYNGIANPTIFDKPKRYSTLGQDSDSYPYEFYEQKNVLYKGKSSVKNGYFTFEFIVPKDINYDFGNGKVSFYSQNNSADKMGYDTTFIVGGIDPNGLVDNTPPEIDLFLNDENFVSGGLTDTKPLLIAKVRDENGFNTSGNGIGHDITAIIDGNTADPIILNNFYEADLDTYKSGEVRYQFFDLEEGPHQLTFKIWDVNNNSAETTLDFVVAKKEELSISHLLNYPNPFTTHTEFFFEHNQIHNLNEVKIEIFTVSGKLVRTIFADVNSCAYRSDGIPWNGLDEYGDKLARGVYVYRLTVKNADGEKAEKIEKLYIL
ncbi:MAG: type IX secretion system sortase PorU [Putridiphycobacter sp.]